MRELSQIEQDIVREKTVGIVASGKTQTEAALLMGVSRQSVNKWINDYKRSGRKALKSKKRGVAKRAKLSPSQSSIILEGVLLKSQNPRHCELQRSNLFKTHIPVDCRVDYVSSQ